MKLIYTYFFQYTYILFNNESMLTQHVHLHVFVRHYTNACIFFFNFKNKNIFHICWSARLLGITGVSLTLA